MVGVLPMPLWKHWKVLEMMRVLSCFWKKCWHMKRGWVWTSQPSPDRSPNLDLCRTVLGMGKAKKQSIHTPKISTANKHYFEVFDMVINCIEDRSDGFENVHNVGHNKYKEDLDEVIQFCQKSFDDFLLRSQLPTVFINFQLTTEKDANITLSAVCTYLKKLSRSIKLLLPQVIHLAKLVLVAAATNAISEWSFSAMRRAKSYLKSMMRQQGLNNIMLLHV